MKAEVVATQAAVFSLPDAAEYVINIRFEDFRAFLKDFSENLSLSGMFVETAEPQLPGAEVEFKLSLSDGHTLVEGRGVVAWSRAAGGKAGTAGMAVRFEGLNTESERLVRRVLEERAKAGLRLFDLDQESSVDREKASEEDASRPETQPVFRGESAVADIESLRAEIEELKIQEAEGRRLLQAEIEAAREAEADLSTRLRDSLARAVTASEARDALASQLRFADESQQRDRHRLEELAEKRAELEQEVETLRAEVARLTEEVVMATTGREALERRQESLEEDIETERGKAETIASEAEDLRATLSVEKTSRESLDRELVEARAALAKLEAEADAAETALRESLEQARADAEEERGKVAESSAKVGELEGKVEDLRSELSKIQAQSEAFEAETVSISKELERLRRRHDELKVHAAARRKAAAHAEMLIERVRAEHTSLQNDLLEAQTALGRMSELEGRPADGLDELPVMVTPPAAETVLDEPLESEAAASSMLKGRLDGLVQFLRGGRGAEEVSDQFFQGPPFEEAVSGPVDRDVEPAVIEATEVGRRLTDGD